MTPQELSIPYGFCHCGCGEKTCIAKQSSTRNKQSKGRPLQFIHGHNRVKSRQDIDGAPFKIDGVYCRLIALTRNLYALVDAGDYSELNRYRWNAKWNEHIRGYYAVRTEKIDGKNYEISMHRQVLGLNVNDVEEGDHKDTMSTLDNRRANLRRASFDEQMQNRRKFKSNSTGFKGVTFMNTRNDYCARISAGGKRLILGYRDTAEAAHRELYVPAAKKLHGKFARFK